MPLRPGVGRAIRREDELALERAVASGGEVVALAPDACAALAARLRGAGRVVIGHALPREDSDVVVRGLGPCERADSPMVESLKVEGGRLLCVRRLADARETVAVPTPVALRIDDPFAEPRLLTLWEIAAAQMPPFERVDGEPEGAPAEAPAPLLTMLEDVEALGDAIESLLPTGPALPGAVIARVPAVRRRPPLHRARTVVAGGRTVGESGFEPLVGRLADALGAAAASSGGATALGYAPADTLVGQSGAWIEPALYLALGLSGVDQHVGGIGHKTALIAVNADPEAPIFRRARFGLVGDVHATVPALLARWEARGV